MSHGRRETMENLLRQLTISHVPEQGYLEDQRTTKAANIQPQPRGQSQVGGLIGSTTMPPPNPCQTMLIIFQKVSKLEEKVTGLCRTTNREYWKLGQAYFDFCLVSAIWDDGLWAVTLMTRLIRGVSCGMTNANNIAFSASCARRRRSKASLAKSARERHFKNVF